jgi:hypothetical protein
VCRVKKVLGLEQWLERLREGKGSGENTIAELNLQLSSKNDMHMQLESRLRIKIIAKKDLFSLMHTRTKRN